jgi:hypothetical protein
MMPAKLGVSLSRLATTTVGLGFAPRNQNGRQRRATAETTIAEETEAVATPSTLLLNGVQSVYNGTCSLTCLCTVCTHRVRWADG